MTELSTAHYNMRMSSRSTATTARPRRRNTASKQFTPSGKNGGLIIDTGFIMTGARREDPAANELATCTRAAK